MRLRSALQVACTALLVWICVVSSASSATRRVVLLFDERPELPGLAQLEAELVRTLGSSSAEPIEVYREAMDLSRFSSDAHKVLLRDFLRAKYADKKIDLTVAIMGPALDFLLSSGDASVSWDAHCLLWDRQNISSQPLLATSRQRRSRQAGIRADAGARAAPPSFNRECCRR